MNRDEHRQLVYLEGKRLLLRPLVETDFTPEYLSWLNHPEINGYSQRRPFPVSWKSMTSYVESFENTRTGFVLAMTAKPQGEHIGNVGLVNIQPINRCAEPVILIGRKDYWGKGYGAEAVYLVSKHAFEAMNLHKVFAGTFNPAFARAVEKLGWTEEGRFRQRIWSNGTYHDQLWFGLLRSEFKPMDQYETEGQAP